VDKVRSESEAAVGFNAEEEKVQNLVDAGVIDPTKVVRVAIQNAASIAGLLLTTEAIISELPEKKKAGPPMPGGGGGYEDFD
jgi:chaperonin GroEL